MNEMTTDYREREIWYSLVLSKEGIRDKYFDELVDNLIREIAKLKLPVWDELKALFSQHLSYIPSKSELPPDLPWNEYSHRLLCSLIEVYHPREFIYNIGNLTLFEFQIARSWIPENKVSDFNKIKKDMQSFLKSENRYKGYSLVNTWNYTLTKEEVKEFNILTILSGVMQQLGMIPHFNYNPRNGVASEMLTQKEIEETQKFIIKESFKMKGLEQPETFLILKNITLKTRNLNDSFYSKIERLLNYLYSKGLVGTPNMPDIKERYLKAVEDCNKNSVIPSTFVFFVDCWPREIEKFLLLKEEILAKIRETEYQVRLDSNQLHSDRYGCYCGEVDK